jgi:hypothetical protein
MPDGDDLCGDHLDVPVGHDVDEAESRLLADSGRVEVHLAAVTEVTGVGVIVEGLADACASPDIGDRLDSGHACRVVRKSPDVVSDVRVEGQVHASVESEVGAVEPQLGDDVFEGGPRLVVRDAFTQQGS